MADEPRCTAQVTVRGAHYDMLVARGHAHAVEFLGPDRRYYLVLDDVRPALNAVYGAKPGGGIESVDSWVATARIVYPHEPMF